MTAIGNRVLMSRNFRKDLESNVTLKTMKPTDGLIPSKLLELFWLFPNFNIQGIHFQIMFT
jgi:hypothetical protein